MSSGRKLKVDKANIIGLNGSQQNRSPKAKAGSNITIIKASSPNSSAPTSHTGRVRSPSTSSVSAGSTFSNPKANPNNIIRAGAGSLNFPGLNRSSSTRSPNHYSEPLSPNNTRIVTSPLSERSNTHPSFSIKGVLDSDHDGIDSGSEVSINNQTMSSGASSVISSVKSAGSETGSSVQQPMDSVAIEARVNRKILDLEISNQSLLAVNSILEAKVRQQGEEIEALKKSLGRLTASGVGTNVDITDDNGFCQLDDMDDDDEYQFSKLVGQLDQMVSDARDAIKFTAHKNGGKVLPNPVI